MYLFVFDLKREGLGKPMGAVSAFMQRNYLLQPLTGGNLPETSLKRQCKPQNQQLRLDVCICLLFSSFLIISLVPNISKTSSVFLFLFLSFFFVIVAFLIWSLIACILFASVGREGFGWNDEGECGSVCHSSQFTVKVHIDKQEQHFFEPFTIPSALRAKGT